MKKVLLVNTNIEKFPYPIPPLGLCLLATSLESFYEVRVYDGVFDEGKALPGLTREFRPDYIGFSIRNIDDVVADRHIFYLDRIISDFISPVRKITLVPVILGGSGFSIFPTEILSLTGADYGIKGEGEVSLPALLQFLDEGKEPAGIPGLYKKIDSGTVADFSPPAKGCTVTHSVMERWIDFSTYLSRGVYSIQTKRGCVHHCIYCTYPCIEGKSLRMRDPVDIVAEMENVTERLDDVVIEFVDSTFNEPPGFAETLCREIIRRGLKIRMRTMGINPGNTSAELFELMLKAGFTQIDVTPDSASPSVLRRLGKGFTLKEVRQTADLIRLSGIPSMWFFLFGGPGENVKTFYETLDFIDSYIPANNLVYMNAGLRVYPGTPLHAIAVKEGMICIDDPVLFPPLFYYSNEIGKEKLDQLIKEASITRINCIPALETQPSAELLMEAARIRKEQNLKEPMFRTLLRLRREGAAEQR